jgi:hypothetical protein
MAEKLTFDIQIGGNQDQAIGSLKAQLKEATQEVQKLSDKFGATSEQAIQAAKRASELKDEIGDASSLVDAFNPDAKFKALTASLSGVAGGFAAVQGAIGLFGVESKEVEQALLKVQSAMALSQGLQAIGESIDSFKQLGAVIKNSTVFLKANEMANKAAAFTMKLFGVSVEATSTSFKVLKGAIAATGLGLLVVAIGEIVAAFQEYSSAAEKAAEKQKELNETITKGAKAALKGEQDFLANQEKIDIAKAKLRGASEQELFDIEQRYRKLKAESQVRYWKETKNADAEGAAAAAGEVAKINTEAQVAQLELQAKQAEAKRAAAKAAADELANLESARIEKQLAEEKKLTEEELAEYDKRRGQAKNAKILTQKELNDLDEQDRIKKKEADDKKFADQREALAKIGSYTYDTIIKDQKLKEDARNAELQADIALQNAKFEAAAAGLNLLSSLAGENEKIANAIFIIDKALAIAKIVVDTQREISAYASNPTWSLLPDGGAIIKAKYILGAKIRAGAGIATIAATSIAKFKGGGSAGGVGGGASAPSVSAGAPLAPPPPQAQTTTLDNQSINALGSQTSRAYVLESDVTNSQQRIAAIQQRARFG